MNSDRTQSYGRVVKTLDDLGPTKLLPTEQEIIREAADTLIFTEDLVSDPSALDALDLLETLTEHLVSSGRWTEERAEQLRDDVQGCGPLAPVG
jgi:hypothetical protein